MSHNFQHKITQFREISKQNFSTPNFGRIFDFVPVPSGIFDFIFLILHLKKYRKNTSIVLRRDPMGSQIPKTKKKSFFRHKSTPTQNHVTFLDFWKLQAYSEFNSTTFEPKTKRRTALRAAR